MKLIYLDVETTGIPCPDSGLIQLAGQIEIDDEVVENFDFRIIGEESESLNPVL